jgi:prolipoprotein diacylglyceryltransferase
MHATGLYPSQLYESAGGLLMFLIILASGRLKTFAGFQFYLMGLCYCVLRFIVDFSRYYGANERLAGLSHNQIVCIVLFVIFGGLILKGFLFKEEKSAQQPSPTTNGTKTSAPAHP